MAGKRGPETLLVNKMRVEAKEIYGEDFVVIKHHGSQFSEAGVSDLLCCLFGIFVAAEVKAPKNYGNSVEKALEKGPTPKQMAFIARVNRAGGVAGVVADMDGWLALLAEAVDKADPIVRDWLEYERTNE